MNRLRVAVLLPGLGRVQRGAETAFLEIANGLNQFDDLDVHLFGSSTDVPDDLKITAVECTPREKFERWPKLPMLRSECHYEEFSWVGRLWRSFEFNPKNFDVTISCTYPWVNWFLRRMKHKNRDLTNLFVTQNGDWMCRSNDREYKYFKCDGVVAINPEYYANNKDLHRTELIPNGTDPDVFFPSEMKNFDRWELGEPLPTDKKIVLMASAMIESKRVAEGLQAAAKVEDAYFVVAGDGPEREKISKMAEELMPGRHRFLGSINRNQMAPLFRRADLFLHMSQIEPFGIVYLEAAATGLPIVTHDGPTPRWILGDTALFADSNQLDDVADAIRQGIDPGIGLEYGRAARQRVIEDWTWKAQAAKYRKFIRQLRGLETNEEPSTIRDKGGSHVVDHHRQLQHS